MRYFVDDVAAAVNFYAEQLAFVELRATGQRWRSSRMRAYGCGWPARHRRQRDRRMMAGSPRRAAGIGWSSTLTTWTQQWIGCASPVSSSATRQSPGPVSGQALIEDPSGNLIELFYAG